MELGSTSVVGGKALPQLPLKLSADEFFAIIQAARL